MSPAARVVESRVDLEGDSSTALATSGYCRRAIATAMVVGFGRWPLLDFKTELR